MKKDNQPHNLPADQQRQDLPDLPQDNSKQQPGKATSSADEKIAKKHDEAYRLDADKSKDDNSTAGIP